MMPRSRRTVVRSLLALLVAAPLAACGDSTGPLVGIEDVSYAPALEVDLDALTVTASGLGYQDLAPGTGPAAAVGDTVTLSYVGRLTNGTVFDQSTPQRPTIEFGLGVGTNRAIAGFEEGLLGMRAGGRRKLVIPPALGYGHRGQGAVPGNEVIVFDVELVSVR